MNIICDFKKPVFAKEKNGKVNRVETIYFWLGKIVVLESTKYRFMPIKDVEIFQHFVGSEQFDLDKPIFAQEKNGRCQKVQSIHFDLGNLTVAETSGQDESLFRWLAIKEVELVQNIKKEIFYA